MGNSNTEPRQMRISFGTQLKTTLTGLITEMERPGKIAVPRPSVRVDDEDHHHHVCRGHHHHYHHVTSGHCQHIPLPIIFYFITQAVSLGLGFGFLFFFLSSSSSSFSHKSPSGL